jgi:putative phage-type endonuclease
VAISEEKESYLSSRQGGIGGTDAAAILGISPWKRPIQIYEGKINPGAQPELDKELLWWGSALEPIVRGRYAERFGVDITAPAALASIFPNSKPWRDSTLVIGRESWMLGAPDGWIASVNSGLEVKCSSRRSDEWGIEGSDEVPAHYLVQVAWYQAVCEAQGWNFAVLFSGNTLEQFRIRRDMDLERDMIEVCRSFWFDNVLKHVEPDIDESESYGRYLARKFSLNTGAIIKDPGPEIIDWTVKMKDAEDAEKQAAADKQLANNHLRALIGDAQKAITPMGSVGWVRPKEDGVTTDWKAFALACNRPDLQPQFEKPAERTAYLRAWWAKKKAAEFGEVGEF